MLLSVIIPTRNRAQRLADLLDSLAGQEPVPFEWEVIVVDNASTDATAEVTQQKSETLPITIRHVVEPRLGLHYGRHRGAKEARGKVLAYLDDDMILDRQWIRGTDLLLEDKADAVVGRVLPKWEAEPPGWLAALWSKGEHGSACWYLGLLDLGDLVKPIEPSCVFGGNCFIKKEILYSLGGFHPDAIPSPLLRFRGDGETGLMVKFKQRGLRSFYDPKATAFHIIDANKLTVEYVCSRAYNQGISNSFAQIRAEYGLAQSVTFNSSIKNRYERHKQMSPSEIVRAVGRKAKGVVCGLRRDPHAEIRKKIAEAYRAGWQFHQSEVKNDPKLLEYVLKQTYLE